MAKGSRGRGTRGAIIGSYTLQRMAMHDKLRVRSTSVPSFGSRPSDRRRAGGVNRLGWLAPGGQGGNEVRFCTGARRSIRYGTRSCEYV